MRDHIGPVGRARPATRTVGVRELKTHAARILRRVREARASYILTHRGQAIGVILPFDASAFPPGPDVQADEAWQDFLRAGRRLEGRFRAGTSGVRVLSEMRR